jgi:hypothetical protein
MTSIPVLQRSIGHYLPITLNGQLVQTVNPRTKNWPSVKYDCQKCGVGNACDWFAHSQDGVDPSKNLPPECYIPGSGMYRWAIENDV